MAYKLVTCQQMRDIDNETIHERGIAGQVLMERAGEAVAEEIMDAYEPQSVCIVTGKGNNAGDGLVVARLLAERGVEVNVVMLTLGTNLGETSRLNYERVTEKVKMYDRHDVPKMSELFGHCDLLIDAILGTGIVGAPRGGFGEAIAVMNSLDIPTLAIDIPSGLNSDTGEAEGACILADITVTIGLPKCGMVKGEGPEMCGTLIVKNIGFPDDLLENPAIITNLLRFADVADALPYRPADGHKGTFGSLLVIAGSVGMSGAACLTTSAALRSGCGLVFAAVPENILNPVDSNCLEALKIPLDGAGGNHLTYTDWDQLEPHFEKINAIALGPGIGTHEDTARLVDEIVCLDIPIVIDADGLNCLGDKVQYLTKRTAATVITPHPGEMARIMGSPVTDREGAARELAREANVVVVLKGAKTVIAHPDGNVYINPTGNDGMGKGGSGDLLTGLIGGLLAQGCTALDAACAGTFLHGFAGDLTAHEVGKRGMTAGDILKMIPDAFQLSENMQ